MYIKGQRKAFYRQRIPESSYAKKETVDIDILVTSRNGDRKIMQSIWRTSSEEHYQSNTYRKDLNWSHFDDEPRVQKRSK